MNRIKVNNLWVNRQKIVSGFLIALLVFSTLAVLLPLSSNTAVGYTMPGDVNWNMDDLVTNSSGAVTGSLGTYYVHEDVGISVNSTLNVNPGQTVYFDLGTGINVFGYFYVQGNLNSTITFTSNEPSKSLGDWDGISFFNGSNGNIEYTEISYADTGILINNSNIYSVKNNDFTYNVWGIQIINSYCHVWENTFEFNGILPHPDPAYSTGGGIYITNYASGTITDNDFLSNIGGVRSYGTSYYYLMNNYFYDNVVYGVFSQGTDYLNQSNVGIYHNEFYNNQNYGIYTDMGIDTFIENNNITYNRIGIYIHGNLDPGGTMWGGIYGNYIADNTEIGIECRDIAGLYPDLSLSIYGNEINSNNIAGIYCRNSEVNIQSNDILNNQFGIFSDGSELKILTTYFSRNDYTVWANNSQVNIIDCEIVGSLLLDYFLENDSYITSLNTTFDDSAVYFVDGLSTLKVQWYLHILVQNVSGPVDLADVNVTDNENGTWVGNYVTDAQGRVKYIVVTEYIRTLIDWIYYTPHNITATKDFQTGYAEPFMDVSKYVVIDLLPGAAPIPPLPPVDLDIELVGANLELSWGASGDDGPGADDVVEYIIYRATSVSGTYSNVGSVPADDLPTYSWEDTGKGDGDWNNYFYIVRAKDGDGLEDSNVIKVGKFVSSLAEGWNMISVPFIQSNTTREKVLETIDGNYAAVQGYHAGKSKPWKHWHRDKPNYFNDVIEVTHENGYYIDMIVADHLVTVGKVPPSVDINIKKGWNLVGNPGLTNMLRDEALSSISGNYNMVERFDTTTDKEVRLTPSDYMEPGLGYWIHATSDCTWTITN